MFCYDMKYVKYWKRSELQTDAMQDPIEQLLN